MTNPDAFITIRVLHDSMEAEMIREIFAQEGIPEAVPGAMHRGLLGPLGAYIEIPLQVPARCAERARQILDEMHAPSAAWEIIDEYGRRPVGGSPLPAGDELEEPGSRSRKLAAFFAIGITFGWGHFYARAATAGALLLGAEVAVLWIGASGSTLLTFLSLPMLIFADLIGALHAVDRYNQGRPIGGGEQLARTGPFAALAVLWAAWSAEAAPNLHPLSTSSPTGLHLLRGAFPAGEELLWRQP